MKVGWIADHFYPKFIGGAEITDHILIRTGRELGHEVDELGRDSEYWRYDLLVVSNVHTFPKEAVFNLVSEDFVFFLHDPTTHDFYPLLLERSRLNIFLSPLHRSWYEERFRIGNSALIPSPIDVDRYCAGEKRKNYCAYLGLIAKHKGHLNVVEYALSHPELEFHLFGKLDEDEHVYDLPNLFYEGEVETGRTREILAEAEYYIHLPEWVEAFGRAVVEAYLSGCKLITNGNVGCMSYPWWGDPEKVREEVANSRYVFWREIDEHC